ncbi:GtrA family protein [Chthonobacter albigriseus]|uniref:GtrA family protein n=1 Tax=Chthonobacter albigriseus TaxID=1683161 RepID=UPI0015EE3BBF|nr:GtrA family protein [Chthonobacter albigriseus]
MADRLVRFVFVGATGFAVDAGLTEALVAAGSSPLVARVFAFAVAIGVTYGLNRAITFADRKSAREAGGRVAEGGRYLAVNLAAMAVNYAVFAAVLTAAPGLRPMLAVAAGSGVAMVVSYLGYSRFVFRQMPR